MVFEDAALMNIRLETFDLSVRCRNTGAETAAPTNWKVI
jgi:hypothetical protein